MRQTIRTAALLAAIFMGAARGQILETPTACARQWGAPVSGQIDTNGFGILRFASGNLAIEAEFVVGVAQRVVYRSSVMSDKTVRHILEANSHGSEWLVYQRPGSSGADETGRMWIRADEMAMAEAAEGTLTVIGSGWYRHLAEPPPPTPANEPATGEAATDAAPLLPPPPDDPIAGFWGSDESPLPAVALHIRNDGTLSWFTMGETERRETSARWKRASAEESATYTITETNGEKSAETEQPAVMGRLKLISSDRLRWRAEGHEAPEWDARAQRTVGKELAFNRADALPRWKPRVPASLPVKGDTRDAVVRLLGNPTGAISSARREVLLYPWGNVRLANGHVVSAEE